ncbi:MAG: NUDIX domain-containing protein [Thaumarchaeota archaeon]|nr:NUDIX domain-containing protein [Nitrososphaerota archaeon]
MVQKFPEPTVGALIINKDKLLLVKSPKWKYQKWTVPGGHIEVGESAEQAIVREAKEETGLDVIPIKLLLVQEAVFSEEYYKPMHYLFFDFLCKAKNDNVKLDNRELNEYRWFDKKEIHNADVESYTKNLLKAYKEYDSGNSSLLYIPVRSQKT